MRLHVETNVAMTMSPAPPAGRRFRRAPKPLTEMMYRFLAPELSQQLPTLSVSAILFSPNFSYSSRVYP